MLLQLHAYSHDSFAYDRAVLFIFIAVTIGDLLYSTRFGLSEDYGFVRRGDTAS